MSIHRERTARRALAILLTAALLLACPLFASTAYAIDLSKTNTVTVNLAGQPEYAEDLQKADVRADLYLLARAEKEPGYDTYTYGAWEAGFTALPELSAETDWEALAQSAAGLIFAEGAAVTAAATGAPAEATPDKIVMADLAAGLYLLVPHGDLDEYVETVTEEIAKEDGTTEKVTRLVTIAESEIKKYLFTPQLLTLPTKEPVAGEDGETVLNTANPGEWKYELTVVLKAEAEDLFGDLEIKKTLNKYESSEPATFVFEVTGVKGDKVVYTNVAAITLTAGETGSATLTHIPIGAEVTVTEIYSGAHYKVVGDVAQTAVITFDPVASVSFTNDYDGTQTGGHGILNEFNAVENDLYNKNDPNSTPYRWDDWVKPEMNNG